MFFVSFASQSLDRDTRTPQLDFFLFLGERGSSIRKRRDELLASFACLYFTMTEIK